MPSKRSLVNCAMLPVLGLSLSNPTLAQDDAMEVIEVKGHLEAKNASTNLDAAPSAIDISQLLKTLPGAAVNSNGPLTGIAQYRGLYGDRVSTKVNGLSVSGAGPNAMDTPLSYASLILTESVDMSRGIAPVSSGTDTIGGSIRVIESQARFQEDSGLVRGQYQDNGQRSYIGGKANLANQDHALLVYVDLMQGTDNPETGDGREISPGDYDKFVAGGQYRFALDDTGDESIALNYQHLETLDAGTPALPMDINYIRTDRIKLEGQHDLSNWLMDWNLAYSDARHGMDNYSLRFKPDLKPHRYNTADSTALSGGIDFEKDAWFIGAEFQLDDHNSVITDFTKPMFKVDNFNNVTDESYSAFVEWQQDIDQWHWQIGARLKHYRTDADEVSHAMAANSAAIRMLMERFNNADRSQAQTGFDFVINGQYQVSPQLSTVIGFARKQAAASYQQRYLWVPMQSTGGMADGRTYVGKMDLDLETAYQLELGLNYQANQLTLTPRVFFHQIDDYIQGVQATDPAVIMAATMMGDPFPLMFENTDARLFGMDIQASYLISQQWHLDMLASYTTGERTDVDDHLYRIAPPNIVMGVNYQNNAWFARLEGVAVKGQNKVSQASREQATAGYGLIHVSAGYDTQNWQIKAGIDNLLDREYQDHMGAYNRVMMSDLAPGERMSGLGLSAWLSGEYRF